MKQADKDALYGVLLHIARNGRTMLRDIDIAWLLGYGSHGSANLLLRELAEEGRITIERGASRSTRIVGVFVPDPLTGAPVRIFTRAHQPDNHGSSAILRPFKASAEKLKKHGRHGSARTAAE